MSGYKKVTLKYIAQEMGYTPATISKALRDANDISKETREKIKKMAAELGYQPNIMARSLVQKKSFLLGVIVPNLRISFFSELVRGIYENARKVGYEAIIMVNDEDPRTEQRNLQFLSAMGVDGILIDAVPGDNNLDAINGLLNREIPFVSYDRMIDGIETPAVTIDDKQSAFDVMEYFVQQGRKKIMFLGPTEKLYVARGRFTGYKEALKRFNLPFDESLVVPTHLDESDSYVKMKSTLADKPDIDAVMCVGGLVAFGAGKAILETGKKMPDDILLGEFGDNNIVARLGVPYVTVYQSPYKMGQVALEMILDIIENPAKARDNEHKIIETELIYHEIGLNARVIHQV